MWMFDAVENNGKYTRSVDFIVASSCLAALHILVHCLQVASLGTADHNVCPSWWTLLHLSIV